MEQTAETLARVLARDPRMLMEFVYLNRTGRTAREFDQYPLLTLQALLFHADSAGHELGWYTAPRRRHWLDRDPEPRRRLGPGRLRAPKVWDQAVDTGDPVADAWERAIARGETPDLGKPGQPLRR